MQAAKLVKKLNKLKTQKGLADTKDLLEIQRITDAIVNATLKVAGALKNIPVQR